MVLVVLCSSLLGFAPRPGAAGKPLVPAMFVFGDSLVDVGNNNHLASVNDSCKANYRPYGVDYHPGQSPTGRFSNGYNLADHLARWLGFAGSPPPFLSLANARARHTRRTTVSTGINFASGGSGLLPTTGDSVCGGAVVSMAEQVGNFTSLVRTTTWEGSKRRERTAPGLVSESLVFISVGSNDLFEYSDFFADPKNRNVSRNDTAFLGGLVALYATYVKDLYAAGATMFSVVSPSLVGCCPSQRKIAEDTHDVDGFGCLGTANNLSRQLYPMIGSMLESLSQDELPGMKYSLGDAVAMAQWIFTHASTPPNNFTTPDRACCGSGDFGSGACNSSAPLCPNRSSFFFWDRFHPTETLAAVTAQQLFSDNGTFVHPINVQQLVAPSSRP